MKMTQIFKRSLTQLKPILKKAPNLKLYNDDMISAHTKDYHDINLDLVTF